MAQNEQIKHYASHQGREPVSCICKIGDTALRLYDTTDNAAFTSVTFASFETDSTQGTPIIAETSTGVTVEPARTITYDATVGKLRLNGHGIERDTAVIYTASGTPFGSLANGGKYYLRDVTDDCFNLSHQRGTEKISLDQQSGTHQIKIVGQVIYTPQSNAAYPAVGTQYCCFFVANSGTQAFARSRFPEHPDQNDGGMIEVAVK